ncbi:hypothetical protein [Halobaculum sp. D14]|uniref:hypothetical protein n=1 Tax=Halobaculum sp. D14 TaxID=3421642 RepID=UPI003EB8DB67
MTGTDPQQLRAKRAIERALNGELYNVGDYSVVVTDRNSRGGRRYRTTLPKRVCEQLEVDSEDEAAVFADVKNGAIVYSFGDADEQ